MITKDSKDVLVAEDSLFFRVRLSTVLVEAGHRVIVAGGGEGVREKLGRDPDGVDLLVLDLQAPAGDIFSTLEWLGENGLRGRFPVMVVTGAYERDEVRARLGDLGVARLLTKAFTPEQVLFTVNQVLFPEKIKRGKARKRVPVSIPVEFTAGELTRTGFLLNLSDSGVFLHTDVRFDKGAEVNLQFSLAGLHKVLNLDGRVLWTADDRSTRGFFYGYGIAFNSITDEDREILGRFVDGEMKRLGF